MSLFPQISFELEYNWDAFFKDGGNLNFEWYGGYPEFDVYLHHYMKPHEKVLVVGCGNSNLSCYLYDVGYKSINNIDTSKRAIKQMKSANLSERPGLVFEVMDAMDMTFESENFNVVIDKGTLDALMAYETPTTHENITKYFNEIDRVLKIGGRYIVITLLQRHVYTFLLRYFLDKWMIETRRCFDLENESAEEQGAGVFMVVCTKFKKKKPGFQSVSELY